MDTSIPILSMGIPSFLIKYCNASAPAYYDSIWFVTRTRHSRSNLLNRIFIARGRRTVYSSSAWLTKETVHPLPSHYNKNKHSFRGFLSASGAMLILYQPKNRRSIFCVPTKRLSKTVKPINAARETAMGSRSPAGPRRLRTETRTVRVSVPKALCFSPTFPRSMQRWQRMLF